MLPEDADVVSVDDHLVEPPSVWVDRAPAKWRDRVPHVVDEPDHAQSWVWDGRKFPLQIMGTPETRNFRTDGTGEDFYARHCDDMIEACYDPTARAKAMDLDGVAVQTPFPTFPRFAGAQFLNPSDAELSLHVVQAYNDWLLEEWCGSQPDRFISVVILPLWDPQLAAAEVERTAAKGAKSVTFPENPAPLGLPSFWSGHWDPVLAAVSSADLPLSMHIGTGGGLVQPSPESTEEVGIALCGLSSMSACTDLIFSGVLHRFPDLRIALSEGGSGWVPYLIERMDYTWERTRLHVDRSMRPSELFERHFWTCFISDDIAVSLRHEIGVHRLMYETDFPHNDCNYPNGRAVLEKMLLEVPEDEARMIAGGNARDFYNFHTALRP